MCMYVRMLAGFPSRSSYSYELNKVLISLRVFDLAPTYLHFGAAFSSEDNIVFNYGMLDQVGPWLFYKNTSVPPGLVRTCIFCHSLVDLVPSLNALCLGI